MAHHALVIHPLVVRCVQVARVVDVTPRMRRITLTGAQLGAFTSGEHEQPGHEQPGHEQPAFATPAFDDHVKLIFAADGDVRSVLPKQLAHGIEWGPSLTRQGRDYTPRRFDSERLELDLDFVLHGDGPAAAWAQQAKPGDELWFAGPKSSTVVPADLGRVLLAGDETALPAIARFFEERPSNAPVHAVITVPDPAAKQRFALREDDEVTWVIAEPGDPDALAEAVAEACGAAFADSADGAPFVWAAAESRSLLAVRRFARAIGVPKSHTNITGYWHAPQDRRSASGVGANAVLGDPVLLGDSRHAPDDGEPSHADGTAGETDGDVRALPEQPVHWFAVRAALLTGVLDFVAETTARSRRATISPGELAAACDTDPEALSALVRVLIESDVLVNIEPAVGEFAGEETQEGAHALRLGSLGEMLVDDDHAREQYTGLAAEQMLALAALPAALRVGAGRPPALQSQASQRSASQRSASRYPTAWEVTAWEVTHRSTLLEYLVSNSDEYAELVDDTDQAAHVLAGLQSQAIWSDGVTAAITGPGAVVVSEALAATPLALTIVAQPVPLSVLQAASDAAAGCEFASEWNRHDLAVAAFDLEHRTDAEVRELFVAMRASASRAVVIDQFTPDGLGESRSAADALVSHATIGTAHRSPESVFELAAQAGWVVRARHRLGWGVESVELASAPQTP